MINWYLYMYALAYNCRSYNNHHIFGRGIWEKEIVSAKCHTKQLWVYMYVTIQQYKRIGMWAAVIWIDEDMKNLESTLLAISLYIWLPNQPTGLNERTKKIISSIANQLIKKYAHGNLVQGFHWCTTWSTTYVTCRRASNSCSRSFLLEPSGTAFPIYINVCLTHLLFTFKNWRKAQ